MSLRDSQWEFAKDVRRLLAFIETKTKLTISLGEVYRTKEQQLMYLEEGKSKTMNSLHRDRLALDLNFFLGEELTGKKEDLQPIGDFWESLNKLNRWGGNWDFYDAAHFERKRG